MDSVLANALCFSWLSATAHNVTLNLKRLILQVLHRHAIVPVPSTLFWVLYGWVRRLFCGGLLPLCRQPVGRLQADALPILKSFLK